jgi:ABC-type sugar transport system ATPase subunit
MGPSRDVLDGFAMTHIRIANVSKFFGATCALSDVSLEINSGTIVALLGENGAGKSTLIKILAGIYAPDAGRIELDGRQAQFKSLPEAVAAGVVLVPQELRVVGALTVAENMLLGHLPSRRLAGVLPCIDTTAMRTSARAILEELDVRLDVDARAGDLSFAERQLIVIGRALGHKARILILDEPTASLEKRETERLFKVVRRLRDQGVTVIYISHRLEEVDILADSCVVLRDGRVAAEVSAPFVQKDLVHAMTGREMAIPAGGSRSAGVVRVSVSLPGGPLTCKKGEVIGLGGLLGSGATELLRRLFGVHEGRLSEHEPGFPRDVSAAIEGGVGFVPGERALSLIMALSIRDNIVLPHLSRFSTAFGRDEPGITSAVSRLIALLDIRPADPYMLVRNLSGGNQQKVVFAKWLAGRLDLLLLDEPTNGVDIAAKAHIHKYIADFASNGGAVILSSSDMPELLGLSDAVVALRQGRVVGRVSRDGDYGEGSLRALLETAV